MAQAESNRCTKPCVKSTLSYPVRGRTQARLFTMTLSASSPLRVTGPFYQNMIDDEYESNAFFGTPEFNAYAIAVYDIIAKGDVSIADIKRALGDRYSERYPLMDVIIALGNIDERQAGAMCRYSIRTRFVQSPPQTWYPERSKKGGEKVAE